MTLDELADWLERDVNASEWGDEAAAALRRLAALEAAHAELLDAAEELLRLRDAEVTAFPDARYLKAWDRLRKLVRP